MWFLGIDVGTTHVKVVGVTAEGVALDPLKVRTPVAERDGAAFHDGEAIWQSVRDLVHAYAEGPAAGAGLLGAVSIGTFGQEESFPVDERGVPVAGSRVWWETWPDRALDAGTVSWLDSLEHYRVSGMRFRDNQTPDRIAQLRAHRPEAWARTRRWVDVGAYVAFRLTGEWRASSTQVTHSQVFDLATLRPHAESLARLDLDASLFVEVAHPGERIGRVRADALPEAGLAPDAAAFVGGHDQVMAAYAHADDDDARVLDSIGTAEYVMVTGGAIAPDERLYGLCADIERGWRRGQYVVGWGLPTGKILQQLAGRFFGGDFERLLWAIDPQTTSIPDLSDRIRFEVSDLRRIDDDLFSISGVTGDDLPEQIVRACTAQLSARIVEAMGLVTGIGGLPLDAVMLTGSLFQRPEMVRHRERAWGVPLRVSTLDEAVATGAARLARASHTRSTEAVKR